MNIAEITAGAHTVEHLGRYIEELKHSAERMAEEMGARWRDYYSAYV